MRLAAYLSTSRHGVFYFRWPLPTRLHPTGKRSHVLLSLGTRCPITAERLSRMLVLAAHSRIATASASGMNYADIRQHVQDHFRGMLARFKNGVAEAGPIGAVRADALAAAQGLAESDDAGWAATVHPEGASGLVEAFCSLRGIPMGDLSPQHRQWLLHALRSGHHAYAKAALGHVDALERFDLEVPASAIAERAAAAQAPAEAEVEQASPGYEEVLGEYLNELKRTAGLAPKTASQKQEVLALLGEITEQKPVAKLTKADARHVKDVLTRYPQNRQKKAATKGKPLREVLDLPGVTPIGASTVNTYLSHIQTFMRWAVDHGHAKENLFDGMRVKARKAKADKRDAFTTDQLTRLYEHLTDNPLGLVKTDAAKWCSLIGMFTGMRLNEIAQLETADIKQVDGHWCIDVSDVGEGTTKRLKTSAADRRVPLHARLIATGFLDFVEAQRTVGHVRLFPALSYCPKNGYGRAVSRWFNNTLLAKLGLKSKNLVFHSFRHTMNTQLRQADVEDAQVKAILGHEQQGVGTGVYFKGGFRLVQLRTAIDKFSF